MPAIPKALVITIASIGVISIGSLIALQVPAVQEMMNSTESDDTPVAVVRIASTEGTTPLSRQFSGGSDDACEEGAHVLSFGDGERIDVPLCSAWSFDHAYPEAGTYTAELTVTDRYPGAEPVVVWSEEIIIDADATSSPSTVDTKELITLLQPKGGEIFPLGEVITVVWRVNEAVPEDAQMYIAIARPDGGVEKSQTVDYRDGVADIDTSSSCNNFFSDAIDSDCSTFRYNVTQNGKTEYFIRAGFFTPKDACFGPCPASATMPTFIETAEGAVFNMTDSAPLCASQFTAAEEAAAASQQVCTQEVTQMQCGLDASYTEEAVNGCVRAELENRGWSIVKSDG